jgi:hypothetical protein
MPLVAARWEFFERGILQLLAEPEIEGYRRGVEI